MSMFKRKSASMRSMSANERSLALLLEELKKDQSTLAALAKRKETIQNELKTLGTRPPEPFTFDASSRCHYSLPIRHPITGDTPFKRQQISPLRLAMRFPHTLSLPGHLAPHLQIPLALFTSGHFPPHLSPSLPCFPNLLRSLLSSRIPLSRHVSTRPPPHHPHRHLRSIPRHRGNPRSFPPSACSLPNPGDFRQRGHSLHLARTRRHASPLRGRQLRHTRRSPLRHTPDGTSVAA